MRDPARHGRHRPRGATRTAVVVQPGPPGCTTGGSASGTARAHDGGSATATAPAHDGDAPRTAGFADSLAKR